MTKQDVITRARRLLNDSVEPYRWDEQALHDAIVDAVRALNNIAPQTRYVAGALTDATPVPDEPDEEMLLHDRFAEPLALYAAAVCYSLDDPDNQNAALSESYLAKARSLFQM